MVHPIHPKCECGGALYKTRVKGESSKKTDEWRWCRNPKCKNFMVDTLTGQRVYDFESNRPKEAVTGSTFEESPVVTKVREEIKSKLSGEMSLNWTLMLVVVAQELGYHDLGEKLIERFALDEIYKIKKRR